MSKTTTAAWSCHQTTAAAATDLLAIKLSEFKHDERNEEKREGQAFPRMQRNKCQSGSDGLEGEVALLVDDTSEAVLAPAKNQVGSKVGLTQ